MSGVDFTKLDARFKAVTFGSCIVLELTGASSAPVRSSAPAEGAPKAAKSGESKPKKAAAAEAEPAAAVLGPDGKPLSKKELRILERQKREVCTLRWVLVRLWPVLLWPA